MAYFSVLDVTPNSDEWVADYVAASQAIVERHGGRYVARTANHERLEGDGDGEGVALRIILEWHSKDAAVAFMNDPEYIPHLQARTAGSVSNHFLIEGRDDLA